MTSCTGVRYTYFNKQKVPYTASEEIKPTKTIPPRPFLNKTESELKGKMASNPDKENKRKDVTADNTEKKTSAPATLQQIFTEKNITKYIPKQYKNIQSENNTLMDRETMIVVLVVLILVIFALLGDVLGLLFLALLVLLVYVLIKYLGIFN
jgi:hypothetical protein